MSKQKKTKELLDSEFNVTVFAAIDQFYELDETFSKLVRLHGEYVKCVKQKKSPPVLTLPNKKTRKTKAPK